MGGITHIITEGITTDIVPGHYYRYNYRGHYYRHRAWAVGVNGRAGYYRYW